MTKQENLDLLIASLPHPEDKDYEDYEGQDYFEDEDIDYPNYLVTSLLDIL